VRGDLGVSFVTRTQVSSLIAQRLPYTLQLTVTSLLLAYLFGIPLGVVAALKRGTKLESVLMSASVFMYSMPRYWLGIIFMLVFGLYLKVLPISGIGSQFSMVLPMLTLALPSVASLARLMRTEMVEVLTEDYVRTAWAKGLPSSKVIWQHALRNALIPVVVMFFMDLPWLIGGAVIVESVFAWPGLGLLLYHSILNQDFPVAQAIIFFIALLTVISNILGDVLSAYLDPRIRVEKGP
jgi:ABC-type dipeptide/oligopeptide/nickel transport system permease component